MSEEPKWFSGYIKTHDQDHEQLEQKIENCITLPELEGNIEAFTERIDTLSAVIQEIIANDPTIHHLLKRLDGATPKGATEGEPSEISSFDAWKEEQDLLLEEYRPKSILNKIKEKAQNGMIKSYHHFLDELENAIKRIFIKELYTLEKKYLIDSSSGDVLEVEAVVYSDLEKLIKRLEEDLETTVTRTNIDTEEI